MKPYIENKCEFSFIVATRNDNHGGNMREKNQFFINRWINHVKKYNLNCELIIVDWNSKVPLRKILKSSLLKNNQIVKIIEVSNQIHKKFQNSKKINFFQMIAKNIGARRANGKFLIFTNIDIVFSEEFFYYLKNNTNMKETIYRADRYDFDLKNLKNYEISEDKIKKLTTHIHKKNYSYDIKKKKKYYLRKTIIYILKYTYIGIIDLIKSFFKFIIDFIVNLLKFSINFIMNLLKLDIKEILIDLKLLKSLFNLNNLKTLFDKKLHTNAFDLKLLKSLFNLNNLKTLFDKKLHTNACGDFTMIDKQSFYKMKGYYEFNGFSWHIDSLLLFKAYYYLKLNFINLNFPIYHINHEPGKKYSTKGKISIKKMEKNKLNFINDQQLLKLINNYRLNKFEEDDKKINWGLSKEKLPIHTI
jgi:hypothetical protein